MPRELKEVIEELKKEGIEAAKAEAEKIVADAKAEAEKIIADAKAEAEKIVADARAEAQRLRRQLDTELAQAARVGLDKFRSAVENALVVPAIDETVGRQLQDKQFLEKIIMEVVKGFVQNGFKGQPLEVILPADLKDKVSSSFAAKFKMMTGASVNVEFDDSISFGFKIGPKEEGFVYDLSDEGFREMFVQFLSPRFRDLFLAIKDSGTASPDGGSEDDKGE